MAADALRVVFTELGFEVDDEALGALNANVEEATANAGALAQAVDEASIIVDDAYASEAKAAEEAAAKVDAASKTMLGAVQKLAAEHWGIEIDTKEVEEGSKRVDGAFKQIRATAETALGSKLFAQVSKLSPAFAGLAKRLNVGKAEMAAFGRIAVGATLGAIAAFVGGAAAAYAFASSYEADARAMREAADAARVTTTQYQTLTLAGARAGVSAETTTAGLNTLATGLRAIETRSGGPTGALWRLGVAARNADGTMRDTNDVLADVADRFQNIHNPIQRARLAQELFGANWRQMLRVIDGGSAALRAARQDFADLGGGMLPEATEAAGRFGLAQNRMGIALNSIRSVIAVAVLPVVTAFTNKLANLGGWVSRMVRGSNILQVALSVLGAVAAAVAIAIIAAWGPIVAPFLGIGLAIGALLLLMDDVVTLFRGGESEVGKFIDRLYGVGTATMAVRDLKAAWEAVTTAVSAAIEKVKEFTLISARGHLRGLLGGGGAVAAARAAAAARTPPPTAARAAPATPGTPRGGVPGVTAPAPTTAPAPRGGPRTVNNRSSTINNIAVHGVTDPRAVAQQVDRILTERRARERDAQHPHDVED